jgi:hypothetical protein
LSACALLAASASQDFLQVLSMFAGFGFEWPPAIKALYNAFSILNFNFELLAPECSVSINFEAKWCVPESLAGIPCHFPPLCVRLAVVGCR